MTGVEITIQNIESYRGTLTIGLGDLPMDLWAVFDFSAFEGHSNGLIVPLRQIISSKNELLDQRFLAGGKADPRQTAFNHIINAATGCGRKRAPLSVQKGPDKTFTILDGNATAQVLMLTGWNEVPVLVENP